MAPIVSTSTKQLRESGNDNTTQASHWVHKERGAARAASGCPGLDVVSERAASGAASGRDDAQQRSAAEISSTGLRPASKGSAAGGDCSQGKACFEGACGK